MKIKKPSLKGMKNCEYLEHFAQDKYIQQGHNDSGKPDVLEKRAVEAGGGPGGGPSGFGMPKGARGRPSGTRNIEISERDKLAADVIGSKPKDRPTAELALRHYDYWKLQDKLHGTSTLKDFLKNLRGKK